MRTYLLLEPSALRFLLNASFVGWVTGLLGCSTPANQATHFALEAGFTRQIQTGTRFQHIVFLHNFDTSVLDELHVYIEGDGTPWIGGQYPALDPTPRNPLALRLMRQDPAPALYLGRPCYFGLALSKNCRQQYWTSERYSADIVASMLSIIQHYQREYRVKRVVLIGYRGGVTLAALLARELQGEIFLLTLAGNLDTDLWVELRGFLPLNGSLNPLNYRGETAHIPQLHLAGLRDKSVPIAVTESYASVLNPQFFRYYPFFDHACCWLELWPDMISEQPWSAVFNK